MPTAVILRRFDDRKETGGNVAMKEPALGAYFQYEMEALARAYWQIAIGYNRDFANREFREISAHPGGPVIGTSTMSRSGHAGRRGSVAISLRIQSAALIRKYAEDCVSGSGVATPQA